MTDIQGRRTKLGEEVGDQQNRNERPRSGPDVVKERRESNGAPIRPSKLPQIAIVVGICCLGMIYHSLPYLAHP